MDVPKVKYVKATVTNSCVPACLAMVTGKTLSRVIKDIHEHWEDEGRFEGMDDEVTNQYLANNGFAVQKIEHEYAPNKILIDGWPVDPFAPIHIVDVWSTSPPGMHAVVMDINGVIYDPSNRKMKMLSEYQRVFGITGIWKVTNVLINITK